MLLLLLLFLLLLNIAWPVASKGDSSVQINTGAVFSKIISPELTSLLFDSILLPITKQ